MLGHAVRLDIAENSIYTHSDRIVDSVIRRTIAQAGGEGHREVADRVAVTEYLSAAPVGEVVSVKSGMDSAGVAERGADSDFLQGPARSAVCVANCQRAEGSEDEDFFAAVL